MKTKFLQRIWKVINNYLVFFLVVAFVVTCCMMLFASVLAESTGLVFTQENISVAAKITFVNVLLLTLIYGTIDYLRRRFSVDRPVRIITAATEKIMQGDFSVRIQPVHGLGAEGFNQIIDAINKMAQELAGTETLRTDFIANVSHELKTPLAVMGNYATMLKRPGISKEERVEYATSISQASQRLAQLVTNILKLNKLENQQIFPKWEEFNLGEQLCESLLQFEELWERKDITITADIPEEVYIRSDAELLGIVWSNLLSNALKFTPDGGCVGVRMEVSGAQVVVSVSDNGCGMRPEVGKHIFEKFYQGDSSHATQGNGLGLALVKRVMDILGGEISVRSMVGQGSTFTVTIGRN